VTGTPGREGQIDYLPDRDTVAELCGDGAVISQSSTSFEVGLCCRGTTATRGQIYL